MTILITKRSCTKKSKSQNRNILWRLFDLPLARFNANRIHGSHFKRRVIKFIYNNIPRFNIYTHKVLTNNKDVTKFAKWKYQRLFQWNILSGNQHHLPLTYMVMKTVLNSSEKMWYISLRLHLCICIMLGNIAHFVSKS